MSAVSLLRLGGNFRKIMLSVGAVGAAASIAGLGTFAAFTSSTSASQPVATGTVEVKLGDAGTALNRLTIGASKLAAGDTIQRAVRLSNTGTIDLSSVALTTTVAPETGSVLTSDATHGLQMKIERCAAGWTESGSTPYTYSCSGGASSVVASRPVIGADVNLPNAALSAGTSDNLLVTLTLPQAADNTFQGKSSTIVYSFVGTQRAATSQ